MVTTSQLAGAGIGNVGSNVTIARILSSGGDLQAIDEAICNQLKGLSFGGSLVGVSIPTVPGLGCSGDDDDDDDDTLAGGGLEEIGFGVQSLDLGNSVRASFITGPVGEVPLLIFDTTRLGLNNTTVARLSADPARLGADAAFGNLIGLYEIGDLAGGIDTDDDGQTDLFPGDAGYAEFAILNRVENFEITSGVRNTRPEQFGDVLLEGGKLYAPFVIASGGSVGFEGFLRSENAEDDGVFNDAADFAEDLVAYFAFTAANPDGVEHLRSFGGGIFGFEDLPSNLGISDNDFNDAVFQLSFA